MFSKIKDIEIYEKTLNDIPNPITIVDINNYDILYWNNSFRSFFREFFSIEVEGLGNLCDYPEIIKHVCLKIFDELKDKNVYSYEGKIKDRIIKTQVIKSKAYFFVFIDVTETRNLLEKYYIKIKELEDTKKEKKNLIMKNIKLWGMLASKITQFSFVFIMFFGMISTIIKDYYLGRYEEKERKFEKFMREQNEIKVEMLKRITDITNYNRQVLDILLVRERNTRKMLDDIRLEIENIKKGKNKRNREIKVEE